MTYQETLQYLFTSTPVFEKIGALAYKPGLEISNALDKYLNHPHRSYQTIHVTGTNGKGSVSHLLAAILQKAGFKVGLYTSPHLVDFRERIRVNGEQISEEYVIEFIKKHKTVFEPLHPSFFELTSIMAFDYFRYMMVDYAIIEVGLGGRLDSTNIITPILSIITSISIDHTQFLGNTLGEIAYEKAGIIKENVPVVTGLADESVISNDVILKQADKFHAPVYSLWNTPILKGDSFLTETGKWSFDTVAYGRLLGELEGDIQVQNAVTVLLALKALSDMGIDIPRPAVYDGFYYVVEITGLQGRWQEIELTPYIVLDIGHNQDAWKYLSCHIKAKMKTRSNLYMIIGLSKDKDVDEILKMMPKNGKYLFTQAHTERALPADELTSRATAIGLKGDTYSSVMDAIHKVFLYMQSDDMVFIGGSNFIVAEALPLFNEKYYKL